MGRAGETIQALHKDDELPLDIGQERERVLSFDDISLLVARCCCSYELKIFRQSKANARELKCK